MGSSEIIDCFNSSALIFLYRSKSERKKRARGLFLSRTKKKRISRNSRQLIIRSFANEKQFRDADFSWLFRDTVLLLRKWRYTSQFPMRQLFNFETLASWNITHKLFRIDVQIRKCNPYKLSIMRLYIGYLTLYYISFARRLLWPSISPFYTDDFSLNRNLEKGYRSFLLIYHI